MYYATHSRCRRFGTRAPAPIRRCGSKPLAPVDIRLIDHFIVAGGDAISFSERGLL
jgi:hypothetical protein